MLYGYDSDSDIYVPPKHRRSPDNPYTLSQGEDGRYWVSYKDGSGNPVKQEIDRSLFQCFLAWELRDISELNEILNHRADDSFDDLVPKYVDVTKPSLVEQLLEREEIRQLYIGIAKLPPTQRRRVILYYFKDMTYEEIAQQEGCSKSPVERSIRRAIKKLQEFFSEQGGNLPKKMGNQ